MSLRDNQKFEIRTLIRMIQIVQFVDDLDQHYKIPLFLGDLYPFRLIEKVTLWYINRFISSAAAKTCEICTKWFRDLETRS